MQRFFIFGTVCSICAVLTYTLTGCASSSSTLFGVSPLGVSPMMPVVVSQEAPADGGKVSMYGLGGVGRLDGIVVGESSTQTAGGLSLARRINEEAYVGLDLQLAGIAGVPTGSLPVSGYWRSLVTLLLYPYLSDVSSVGGAHVGGVQPQTNISLYVGLGGGQTFLATSSLVFPEDAAAAGIFIRDDVYIPIPSAQGFIAGYYGIGDRTAPLSGYVGAGLYGMSILERLLPLHAFINPYLDAGINWQIWPHLQISGTVTLSNVPNAGFSMGWIW